MKSLITTALIVFSISKTQSQTSNNFIDSNGDTTAIVFLVGIIFSMMVIMLYKFLKIKQVTEENKIQKSPDLNIVLENLNAKQINSFMNLNNKNCCGTCKNKDNGCTKFKTIISMLFIFFYTTSTMAQSANKPLMEQPGIIITTLLLLLPLLLAVVLVMGKIINAIKIYGNQKRMQEAHTLAKKLKENDNHDLESQLLQRKRALEYTLTNNELAGVETAEDTKGIIKNISDKHFGASRLRIIQQNPVYTGFIACRCCGNNDLQH